MKTIRIDTDIHAYLDYVRSAYGDTNYSDAIRRVLRWQRIIESPDPRPTDSRTADGRTLFEHLDEWRNAPSNTASAGEGGGA